MRQESITVWKLLKENAVFNFKLAHDQGGPHRARDVFNTIEYIYNSTIESERGLRDVIVHIAQYDPKLTLHASEVRNDGEEKREDSERLAALLVAVPGLEKTSSSRIQQPCSMEGASCARIRTVAFTCGLHFANPLMCRTKGSVLS